MNKAIKTSLDKNRGILTVALNRPEIRNAFNEATVSELTKVFSFDACSEDVRVIVLRGEGSVFCAGGDLNWIKKALDQDYDTNLQETIALAKMFETINECPKPVLGAIHGAALGGGVGLTSVCDIVIASAETEFSLSEARLGIVPACIGPFVIAKIGASHARRFFITAERFSAETAKSIGLVHEVVKDSTALDAAIERVVGDLLKCGPSAVGVAKSLVLDLSWPERRARLPDCLKYVAATLSKVRISPEGQEGVRAFLEKRKPSWVKR